MRGKSFAVELSTYNRTVVVSIGQSDDARKRAVKKYLPNHKFRKKDVIKSDTDGSYLIFGDGNAAIFIKGYKHEADWYGTLAHEITHVVPEVLSILGFEWTGASGEAYSYLADYLTMEILKELGI